MLNQLSTTRTRHIQSVISHSIIPLIQARTAYGIAQTTLALLPSDIPLPPVAEQSEFSFAAADTDTKPVQVIGFSSQDEPQVVRLQGQMNRTEFWRPQLVIDELETLLTLNLNPPPPPEHTTPTSCDAAAAGDSAPRHSRRTLLSRVMPSLGPELRSPGNNPEVGVAQIAQKGVVVVKARLEEICLRTVSEFGLFDTMSRQCVIIRVDARC